MNGISRQLEKSLARGPVPRNDLLEKETQAKDEAIGKYHAEHELRIKAEHEKKIADEILVVERARFAQETRRMETSLAEERQARQQAEQRAGEATALVERESGKLRAREQDMHQQMQALTDQATAAKVTVAALEAELSTVRAGMK